MASYPPDFIKLLRTQDGPSFETLYTDTVDQFFRYCTTYYFLSDAEIDDLIGDFYVKVWNLLPTLNPSYNLHAFLRTMFKNGCKDYFKKRKEIYGNGEQLQTRSGNAEDDAPEQLEILEDSYQYDQIKQAMSQLDESTQEILHLKFIEHKTYPEIEQVTRLTQANIRQKASRGLKQLQALLSSYSSDHE